MERNTLEYVVAAITGAIIFTLIVVWISSVNERGAARDCDRMGVTMLNGKPYKCSRIIPTPNTTEVPK